MLTDLLPATTAVDEGLATADVAVLPVGSFEQHGAHLPMTTDAVIAHIIAQRLATDYELAALPPIAITCSHEHEGVLAGSVSISAQTLYSMITEIGESLSRNGVHKLAVVSGHGGNYVLSNVVQEANVRTRRMLLYPEREAVATARFAAGCETSAHEDMHAGEWETSILLHAAPELVRSGWEKADNEASQRPDLLTTGIGSYTETGAIGEPSAATAEKGRIILDTLAVQFSDRLETLVG